MSAPQSLETLRAAIDAIDRKLHALIIERAGTVAHIAAAKGEPPVDPRTERRRVSPIRPAREIQILRSLAARHEGPFPVRSLLGLWRELVAGSAAMQGDLTLAVATGRNPAAMTDLARGYYGGGALLSAHDHPSQVIHAVAEGEVAAAIVPALGPEDEPHPWWPLLRGTGARAPRLVGALPLMGPAGQPAGAYVVAAVPFEPSGDDRSWLAITMPDGISRAGLVQRLADHGLPGRAVSAAASPDQPGKLLLVEIDAYVTDGDPRLPAAAHAMAVSPDMLVPLGGYAVPVSIS